MHFSLHCFCTSARRPVVYELLNIAVEQEKKLVASRHEMRKFIFWRETLSRIKCYTIGRLKRFRDCMNISVERPVTIWFRADKGGEMPRWEKALITVSRLCEKVRRHFVARLILACLLPVALTVLAYEVRNTNNRTIFSFSMSNFLTIGWSRQPLPLKFFRHLNMIWG
jgi:hypothetical protein